MSTENTTSRLSAAKEPHHQNNQISSLHFNQQPQLIDLLYDGFFIVLLLKQAYIPPNPENFKQSILNLLQHFERQAQDLAFKEEDIKQAKYAYCSLLDEIIITQQAIEFHPLQHIWLIHPLPLNLFGSQLAGDHFFEILEQLRSKAQNNLANLELFHYCLLLGFQGKYRLHSSHSLDHLITSVGDQIQYLKNHQHAFSPFAPRPDHIQHPLPRHLPVQLLFICLIIFIMTIFIGLFFLLYKNQQDVLAPYQNIIQPLLEQAHLSIQLP
jgi:type VI secretion system protein ImpK